ncbi:hypothetical protein SCLCIDRAFT_657563 [Scleroderma citrinum Foug A]|uniref:Uncharacterized protein n=1 Tax=Scleroderma citrinum Foug A TaxID=1036808 RepID=A0A0C3E810_9AGAM|nr:hypothetical protein SCLCIDRAFT_657563 [Scleroderma citrinum Foug A]
MYPETRRSRYISLRKNDAREAQKVFFPFMWDLTGSNCDNFLNSSAASSDAMNSYVFLLEAIDQLVAVIRSRPYMQVHLAASVILRPGIPQLGYMTDSSMFQKVDQWEKWERYLDPAGGTNHGNLSSIYWVCKLFGPNEPRVDFAGRCLPIDVRVIRSLKAMILAWASISRFRSYCGEAFPNQATYSGSVPTLPHSMEGKVPNTRIDT